MTNQPDFAPSITFLNWSGDITITWSNTEDREAIEAMVAEKMKQGYSFFIVKPRMLKFLGDKKVELKSADDVRNAKGLVIPDDTRDAFMKAVQDSDVAGLLASKKATPAKAPMCSELGVRAKSASQVLRHQTIAMRPIVGG